MPHAQDAAVKLYVLLLLLVGAALPTTNAYERQALESNSDVEEVDLEWEVFGPARDRHYGINILDRHGEVIISDPTDRVLRAVVKPEDAHASLPIHKVKAVYRRKLRADGVQVQGSELKYKQSEEEEDEEQRGGRDGSVLSRLVKWIWEQ